MQRIGCLVPLAAIQVVGVLFKACGIYNAEIAAVGISARIRNSTGSCAVPRRWFADIIKACPNKFACYAVVLIGVIEGFMRRDSPADRRGIIACEMIFSVSVAVVRL